MTTAWKYLFLDTSDKLEDVLEDLRDLRHSGKPVYTAFMPELDMYILAHEPITPMKAMTWHNEEFKDDPETRLTVPPILEM